MWWQESKNENSVNKTVKEIYTEKNIEIEENSDDVYISKHVVSELMQLLEKTKAQLVFADLILVDQNDDAKVLRYYDSSHFHPDKFRFGWMPAHPTVFVKRELYQLVGPFATDYQIAADYEMLIRMLAVNKATYASSKTSVL